MRSHYTPPQSNSNDAEAQAFMFAQLMSGLFFIELVRVEAVRGVAPNLVVDVMPLITQRDNSGAMIRNATIPNAPVWRLQRGSSAVIMDPVVDDIGIALICDKDTTIARANRKQSLPGSFRTHSRSDAIYLGGCLNGQPAEFIEFTGAGINIKSPGDVDINGLKVLSDGRLQLVDGSIVDLHDHGGVATGSARTNKLGH